MSEADRPEWVKCALTGMYDGKDPEPKPLKETFCGQKYYNEWAFVDAAHALREGARGGRLMLCTKCAEEIQRHLDLVRYDPEEDAEEDTEGDTEEDAEEDGA